MRDFDFSNVALVGMMGSGKSSVGQLLSARLGWQFVDTDQVVEGQVGKPVWRIFAEDGEEYFRSRERDVVHQVMERDYQVIATGGGVVLSPENRRLLWARSRVVWLTASPEILALRVAKEKDSRPLLSNQELVPRLAAILDQREPIYASAHVCIHSDGLSIDEVVVATMRELGIEA